MMSDSERYYLLKSIVLLSKIRVVCPKCKLPFSDVEPLTGHCNEKEDQTHQGLALMKEDFPEFRLSYETAVGHDVLPEKLRSKKQAFDIWFVIEQILWKERKVTSDAERYHLLKEIVDASTIRVVCPLCFYPGARSDSLKKQHLQKETDDIHQGLCLRREDPVTFRNCYQQAIGKAIDRDLLAPNKPVFGVDFVIEQKLSNGATKANP